MTALWFWELTDRLSLDDDLSWLWPEIRAVPEHLLENGLVLQMDLWDAERWWQIKQARAQSGDLATLARRGNHGQVGP